MNKELPWAPPGGLGGLFSWKKVPDAGAAHLAMLLVEIGAQGAHTWSSVSQLMSSHTSGTFLPLPNFLPNRSKQQSTQQK